MGIYECVKLSANKKHVFREIGLDAERTLTLSKKQCAKFGINFGSVEIGDRYEITVDGKGDAVTVSTVAASHGGAQTNDRSGSAVNPNNTSKGKAKAKNGPSRFKRVPVQEVNDLTAAPHVRVAALSELECSQGYTQPLRRNDSTNNRTNGFVNPYNFVPLFSAQQSKNGLGCNLPLGHSAYCDGAYRGSLKLTFQTKTPLISHELASLGSDELPIYRTKRDQEGAPRISGASVKGVLRSLFEQVTGSRLGIFENQEILSHRVSTELSKGLCSAVVLRHQTEPGREALLLGVSGRLVTAQCEERVLLASVGVPFNCIPSGFSDGDVVTAWVQLHLNPKGYQMWRVVGSLHKGGHAIQDAPGAPQNNAPGYLGEPVFVQGTMHKCGKTAGNKHDERLVVTKIYSTSGESPVEWKSAKRVLLVGDAYWDVRKRWEITLDSFSGDCPDGVISAPYAEEPGKSSYKKLAEGRTFFIEPLPAGELTSDDIVLHPGLITRKMFGISPWDLLPADSRPANSFEEFSAADRAFGWMCEGRDSNVESPAYKGHLNFSEPTLTAARNNAIESRSGKTWKLATLNGPKPAQFRFYTRDEKGFPLNGVGRDQGYQAGHQIAGHKVYVHHRVPEDYWSLPQDGWDGGDSHKVPSGRFQNFLAAAESPASTHMAIKDWIKVGAMFECTVTFDNLNRMELAALLWCCQLPQGGVWRMGKGKPLGFGSVRVGIDAENTQIYTHEQVKDFFQDPFSAAPTQSLAANQTTIDELISQFDSWFRQTAPATRNAVIGAAVGTSLPVHYPRLRPKEARNEKYVPLDGYSYQWFVENERNSTGNGRTKTALPLASANADGWALPYQPYLKPAKQNNNRSRRH